MPELSRPTPRVHGSFLAAVREMIPEGYFVRVDPDRLADRTAFLAYVEQLQADAQEDTPRPPGHVPQTTLWWVEGADYLGRISIRHRLTADLFRVGGHIGYDVRPSVRRRGHATAMLRAALPVAHGLGLDPALITCDRTNVASRRVIEAAGGRPTEPMGEKLRFWVPTSPGPTGTAAGSATGS